MLGMGMTIDFSDLKRIIFRPRAIILGVFLQFSIMPLLAFILAGLFNLQEQFILGFIILGSCPGGTASNIIAYLMDADVALSVSLTILSTILACVLTPLMIYFYGKTYVDVDVQGLIKSTFWIVIFPIIDGIILRKILKKKINKILKILPRIAELIVATIIGIIVSLNIESLNLVDSNFLLVIILHNLIGFIIAFLIARKISLNFKQQKTVAIEVAMQNSGLGVTLSMLHFNKLVALPSAIFSLWHNISAIIFINFWGDNKK